MALSLSGLIGMMRRAGATRIYAKYLRRNNNSKQQFYIARGDWRALQMLPMGPIGRCAPADAPTSSTAHSRPNYKAALDLAWLDDSGASHVAPKAQLILYPKYPEIRIGSLTVGAGWSPALLLQEQSEGRILFLGIRTDGRILGYMAASDSAVASEFVATRSYDDDGVLQVVALPNEKDSRSSLLEELTRVHRCGWIESKRLNAQGQIVRCQAPHCGGYTLEAEMGIVPNGRAEPDYLGWEVKQHAVRSLTAPSAGSPITLMTPNPDAGHYADEGVQSFLRKYGYPDQNGTVDRLNFGGVHRANTLCDNRSKGGVATTLEVRGYDTRSGALVDAADAGIRIVLPSGDVIASWSLAHLLSHWQRKHAKAVYVPSECHRDPLQYRYGDHVRLGEGTSIQRFLDGVARGVVFYDPAPKLEDASSNKPKCKERHQFRIRSGDIACLYDAMTDVALGQYR